MAKISKTNKKPIYAFIDASNLFYGGEKSLGWKIDYKKLIQYLKKKYGVQKVFYYGGIEIYDFDYSVLDKNLFDLNKFINYLEKKLIQNNLGQAQIVLLGRHIQRAKFYRKLKQFGYELKLKPVKIFTDTEGNTIKKANCDVDMTFDLIRLMEQYSEAIILSGDGDFAIVLSYLRDKGRKITILARAERAAKEIKKLAGENFKDFHYLRELIQYKK
jgi:uncharacterized LabA/DUF88 family protein